MTSTSTRFVSDSNTPEAVGGVWPLDGRVSCGAAGACTAGKANQPKAAAMTTMTIHAFFRLISSSLQRDFHALVQRGYLRAFRVPDHEANGVCAGNNIKTGFGSDPFFRKPFVSPIPQAELN